MQKIDRTQVLLGYYFLEEKELPNVYQKS